MQVSSKMLFKTAIVGLALVLMLGLFLALGSTTEKASALNPTQWETVRGYVQSYFGGSQYNAGADGEAGLRMTKTDLWNAIDSNGDISPAPGVATGANATTVTGVVSEGDDMATRPVLIDNLRTATNVVPGTEFRCNWSAADDCFSSSSVANVRDLVDRHDAAGFSTDIVVYCVSAHTAAPVTAGFGIIAQVPGGLATDTGLTPNVYALEWARNGWRDNVSTPPAGSEAVAAPEASAGGYSGPGSGWAPSACTALSGDLDLVRCMADWAVQSVGNGQSANATTAAAGQSIDVRAGSVTTLATAGDNYQIPINTLFSVSGLADIDPAKSVVVASSTQHGGTTAMGLKMLGYNTIAGGFINGGLERWNGTIGGELQVDQELGLPTQSIGNYGSPGLVDSTGPTINTASAATTITTTSADISRIAAESATMKVEYGTSSGSYTSEVNNTVLNASKTVSLSGLAPGTTYYVQVTSYDGYANGTTETEFSFTTVACDGQPDLSLGASPAYWAGGYADYSAGLLSIDYTITNNGATDAGNVQLTGSAATNGVTVSTTLPVAYGAIAALANSTQTVKYNIPTGVGSFWLTNSASAEDNCSNSYTYP